MPSPASSNTTLRPEIGDSLEEFSLVADRAGFVGLRIMPVIEVGKSSGRFGKIPVESLLQKRETRRAPGSRYASADWKFETDGYETEDHGFEFPVDDKEAENYSDYFDAEVDAAELARDVVLRNYESRVVGLATDTSLIANAAGSDWTDWAASTPIDDVETAVQAAHAASGLWPNALVLSRRLFRHLRNSQQVLDRVKYSGHVDVRAGQITEAVMAQVFDLPMVIVAGGAENTANEGQSALLDEIWPTDKALVCRVAMTRSFKEPCLGRTFHFGAVGSRIGSVVESYRDESRVSWMMRARMDTDEKLLHPESARLITGLTG